MERDEKEGTVRVSVDIRIATMSFWIDLIKIAFSGCKRTLREIVFERRDAIVEPFISPRLNASETISTTEKIPNNRQKGYEEMLRPLMLEWREKKAFHRPTRT